MSRFVGVALAGSLALTACGSDNTNEATSGTGAAARDCPSGTLNAEGSSAQKNAIDEAIASFGAKCEGADVNYNPTGSGAGVKQFIAGQVDFAGSDSALKTEPKDGVVESDAAAKRCQGNPAWNLPMVTGPIAVAYKLNGVKDLTVTADVAAKIFQGKITTWNDPALVAINTKVKLPATPIKVFFRSDESGTTDNFTKWLHAAAPASWSADPGKKWTGKGEGKEKSAGVVDGVNGTEGAITYVEWSYAQSAKLDVAKVDNGGGPVELSADTVAKAVGTATQAGKGNDLSLRLDYATKEANVYPVILVTYEIVCSKGLDAEHTELLKTFLTHFSSSGFQLKLSELGYAPLPAEVHAKVSTAITEIA